MGQFKWMADGAVPQNVDLRRRGWQLAAPGNQDDACVPIVPITPVDEAHWLELMAFTRPDDRRLMLVVGVNPPEIRARLLADGFGDVVSDAVSIEELEARARRLADLASWVPRRRSMATLEMDLMAREASYLDKPLNLHPREFALLWRLADTPDEPVSKQALVQDIWRLGYMPESNSIAVQMSRLRGKLVGAGLDGLVETVPGGYLMRWSVLEPPRPAAWFRRGSKGRPGRVAAN